MNHRDNFIPPLEGKSDLLNSTSRYVSKPNTKVWYLVVDITIMNFFFAAQQAFLDKAINNSFRFILYKQTWIVFVQRELIRPACILKFGTKGVHQSGYLSLSLGLFEELSFEYFILVWKLCPHISPNILDISYIKRKWRSPYFLLFIC